MMCHSSTYYDNTILTDRRSWLRWLFLSSFRFFGNLWWYFSCCCQVGWSILRSSYTSLLYVPHLLLFFVCKCCGGCSCRDWGRSLPWHRIHRNSSLSSESSLFFVVHMIHWGYFMIYWCGYMNTTRSVLICWNSGCGGGHYRSRETRTGSRACEPHDKKILDMFDCYHGP